MDTANWPFFMGEKVVIKATECVVGHYAHHDHLWDTRSVSYVLYTSRVALWNRQSVSIWSDQTHQMLKVAIFFFLVGCRKMLLIARWYCWLYSHYVPLYTILIPWKPHWIPNGGYVSLAMSVFGKKHRNTHSISQIHESIFCQWFTFINQWTNRPMDHSLSECQVIGTRRPPWTSSAAMQPVGTTTTACEASQ